MFVVRAMNEWRANRDNTNADGYYLLSLCSGIRCVLVAQAAWIREYQSRQAQFSIR